MATKQAPGPAQAPPQPPDGGLPGPQANRWTPKALYRLIWPLMIEQVFAVSIGMADTVMVAAVGEAAVAGVSLVDAINILLVTLFTAMATGGAVVASQYLGRGDRVKAGTAARQLVYAVTALSLLLMVLALALRMPMLRLIYGNLEPAVAQNAEVYLLLSALSYPFIALYNAGAAIFRSMGNSKMGMMVSFLVNLLNIGGNALLIFGLGLGVAGAAISTLVSRAVAGVLLIVLLLRVHVGPITLAGLFRFHISWPIVKQILRIGVPNGLESSIFQVGKLMVARIITTFGTAAIAANAIGNSINSFMLLPGQAFNLALLTVVGQCIGAADYTAARRNTRRLMGGAIVSTLVLCMLVLPLRVPILQLFDLSPEAVAIAAQCLLLYCLAAPLLWPPSFSLPNALRAAGDARYTMVVSIATMWICRIGLSFLFAYGLGMEVLGVWLAMVADWVARGFFFIWRWKSGKWQTKTLIKD